MGSGVIAPVTLKSGSTQREWSAPASLSPPPPQIFIRHYKLFNQTTKDQSNPELPPKRRY